MFKFLFFRLSTVIVSLFGVTLLTYILIHLLPGDPIELMVGERGIDPDRLTELRDRFGLNLPHYQQFLLYIERLLHGDLGTSFLSREPVLEEFLARFVATFELSFFAIIFAIGIGIPAGVIASIKKGSIIDYSIMTVSLTGYSMPIFWWGILMIILFSANTGRIDDIYWVETITGLLIIDTLLQGEYEAFYSAVSHLILPSIVLGTIPMAVIARMTRSAMLDVLSEGYIRAAKARGISSFRIIFIHGLRNALIPVVTIIGLQIGVLLAGAILTENIFSWPGIGKWIVEAISSRDYPVVQGGVFIIACVIIFVNLSVDILYGIINPKIRSGKS